MLSFWLIAAAAAVLIPLLLYVDGKRREKAVERDWQLVLTPKGRDELERARERLGAELQLVDLTYAQARAARDLGSDDEALRLLDVGCKLIEQYCPTMLRAIAAMSVLSRMVAAMRPPRPLRPSAFQLQELAQLARLNAFMHHFLISSIERFRLRLTIMARGFATIARVVLRSTRRAHAGPAALGDELPRLEAARADVRTLSEESLDALRMLLEGLAAERVRS
jgi:hypothetical protein